MTLTTDQVKAAIIQFNNGHPEEDQAFQDLFEMWRMKVPRHVIPLTVGDAELLYGDWGTENNPRTLLRFRLGEQSFQMQGDYHNGFNHNVVEITD
jgi:hypothetical protein